MNMFELFKLGPQVIVKLTKDGLQVIFKLTKLCSALIEHFSIGKNPKLYKGNILHEMSKPLYRKNLKKVHISICRLLII